MGTDPVAIDLTDDEREVLQRGLAEWGGPTGCTDALASVMGFRDKADLLEQGERLHSALISEDPLPAADWRKSLRATEIVFVSDEFGSGRDWSATTGFSDEETIRILRKLQRKVTGALNANA
jgi:hypothetical protein